jgi:hypothetical protein
MLSEIVRRRVVKSDDAHAIDHFISYHCMFDVFFILKTLL